MYANKWRVMAAVAMGVFLATIDASIVNIALPTLVRELNSSFPVVQWVVLAYLLTWATLSLSVGRLGDMLGKKRIYVAGFVVFTAASVLCGLAPGVSWLILFRGVQAVGAAMVLSLGLGLVTEAFPPSERGKALGFVGSIVSVGIVVGPAVGGLLIEALSWRWIFFVNLPVGLAGTWIAARFIQDTRPEPGQRFDWWGAATLGGSLLALLLALTVGQGRGFGDPLILGLFTLSAATLWTFVTIERRVDSPMVELSIFANTQFTVNLITGFSTFASIAGILLLMPFYLENSLGLDIRAIGLLMAVSPVLLGVVSPLSGWLSDRIGSRPLTIAGLAVLSLAYAAMTRLSGNSTPADVIVAVAPIGVGMAIFQSPNNSVIMGSVRPARLGIASAMLGLNRILGQITGIAVLGTIWAVRNQSLAGAHPLPSVRALQETLWVAAALVGAGLLIAVRAGASERKERVRAE